MACSSFAQIESVSPLPSLLSSSSPLLQTPVPEVESSITPQISSEPSFSADPFAEPDSSPCPTILPIPTQPLSRIVGGGPVPPPTLLHSASLDVTFSGGICTATLLSPRWALTAAHCLYALSTSSLTLRVAALDAEFTSSGDGPTIPVVATYQAPRQLLRPDIDLDADLALLYLAKPIPSNYTFARVNANANLPEPYAFARSIGYGQNRRFSFFSSRRPLLQVDLPTVPNEDCEDSWYMTEKNLCAGYEFTECGVCRGDSGGPLMQYAPDGHPVVIGVAARSVACGDLGIDDNFMRVSSFIQWFDDLGVEYENSTDAEQIFAPVRLPKAVPSPSPGPTCPVVLEQLPARTARPLPKRILTGDRLLMEGASESSSEVGKAIVWIGSSRSSGCNGVLISRKWVLTSTACLVGASEVIDIAGRIPSTGYPAKIDRVFPGENSTLDTNVPATNVTLLRLSDSTPDFGLHVLVNANSEVPKVGSFGKLLAHGLEEPRNFSRANVPVLRQVDLPIQGLGACRQLRNQTVPRGLICAGYPSGACGLCGSASKGGPLLMFDKKDRPVVVGLNAGIGGCDVPDVFVGIDQMIGWMRAVGAEFETSDEVVQVESDVEPDPMLVPSPSSSPFFFFPFFPSRTPFLSNDTSSTVEPEAESPEPAFNRSRFNWNMHAAF